MKTKNTGMRKTLELLMKKVEVLENESFAQKLLIDELENKLEQTEKHVKQLMEDPFNIPIVAAPPPQGYQPVNPNIQGHTCYAGPPDWSGAVYCVSCGAHMFGPTWTITSTSNGTSFNLTDPQSSSNTEPVLDLDISWVVPEDSPFKKD